MDIFLIILLFLTVQLALLATGSTSGYFYNPDKRMREISPGRAIVERFALPGKRGRRIIPCTVVSPEGNGDGTVILFIPPNRGNSTTLAPLAFPLAERGHTVWMFDYPGYGTASGRASNRTVLRDAQNVLAYVKTIVPAGGRLFVWGFSLGGNLAVKLASDHPEGIDGLVVEGAFTSHRDIACYHAPKLFKWLPKLFAPSPYPSKNLIRTVACPVLVAHSKNDAVCPFVMGKTLYKNAPELKQMLELSGAHCSGLTEETERYMNKFHEFFKV